MNAEYQDLALNDFARMFGTTTDDFSEKCRELISKNDFRYRLLGREEYDRVIFNVLNKIGSDKLPVSGKERKGDWEKGWSENLRRFEESGNTIASLVPAYIRPNQAVRLNKDYVYPKDPNFELNFTTVLLAWILDKYFKDADAIHEFGCGTGFNLAFLAPLCPEKKLFGLDWAAASKTLLNKVAKVNGWNLVGDVFDFYDPNEDHNISNNDVVLTFAALEQVGDKHEQFLQYLLRKSPKLCVNVECLLELYDENNLLDHLAIRYHKKRGYLNNYLTRLRQLEADGRIEILKTQRSFFGGMYHEVYSYVVWRPRSI